MNKHVDRGFEYLYGAEHEKSDREFRKANCSGGRSLVAFKGRRFEKAMNQACKCLDKEEDCFPYEREVVLKVIKLSLEKADPDEMNRPGMVLPEARGWMDGVSWEKINASLAEFIDDKPLFSDLLEDESAGRDLKEEKIEKAFEFIKSGRLDEGFNLFAGLHDGYRDDPFLAACWAASPDYVRNAPSKLGLNEFRSEVERVLQSSEDVSDEIRASILGFCLFNLYLEWGDERDVLEDGGHLLQKSLECFERAEDLGGGGDFHKCYMGLCYELGGEFERAVSVLDRVSENSNWYSLARACMEDCREEMERVHAVEEIHDLMVKAIKAREGGREGDELQFLEEIDPEYFGEYSRKIEDLGIPGVKYGKVAERIAELKISLDTEPDLRTLKHAVKHNPRNERIVGYLVETGTKKLDEGDFERAIKYFETVPRGHDDLQFLKGYGEALKKSKKYGMAAEIFEELSSTDPDFFPALAECNLHLGRRENVLRDLKDLFRRSSSVQALEKGLKLAATRRIGTDEEIIGFCEKLLAKSDDNDVVLSAKREAEQRLEAKRRQEFSELEEEGVKLYRAEDYRKAARSFSGVPEDFLSFDSVEAMAKSQEALGRHEKALEWYEKLPETIENISSKASCALEMGEHDKASGYCEDLLEMIEKPDEIPHPNVQGLVLEKQERFQEAASRYEDEELVLRLSERLMEAGEAEEGILVLDKLYERFRKDEHRNKLKDAVKDHENELSIGLKSRLTISKGRREVIVCDTNVLVYKAFDKLELSSPRRGKRAKKVIKKFEKLASQGHRMLMTETVKEELRKVCRRNLEEEDADEERRDRVWDRMEKYIEKYGADHLMEGSPVKKENLERARKFYRSYPDKLRKITEKKIDKRPEKRHEILLKRGEIFPSEGTTPGEGDIRLLAECIGLSELSIPGIWRISLLSNDSDFLWFSFDIEREFGIKIRGI